MNHNEIKAATFNRNTKDAVLASMPSGRCCKNSRLLGLLLFGQVFSRREIRMVSENPAVLHHAAKLAKTLVGTDLSPYIEDLSNQHKLCVRDEALCAKILDHFGYPESATSYTIPEEVFRCDKCRTEFIKGVFLSCGNVSDPEKSYHLEMTVAYFNLSRELLYFLKGLSFEAKYTKRSSHYVIYYKESEKIVDFLGLVGATQENFEYYNRLIEKDIRNKINRLNNCETANMSKQIATATKQIDAINRIFSAGGKNSLSDELLETANLRLEHPEASLIELAQLHHPPVTKSCVNRRLNKLLNM